MAESSVLETPLARVGGIDADLGGRVYMAGLRTVGDVAGWLEAGHELADIPRLVDGEAGVLARALLAFRADRPEIHDRLKLEWLEGASLAPPPEKRPRDRKAKRSQPDATTA